MENPEKCEDRGGKYLDFSEPPQCSGLKKCPGTPAEAEFFLE